MTGWELIRQKYPNVDKQYVLNNFGIYKNDRNEPVLFSCGVRRCNECMFDWNVCVSQMLEYFEKEVKTNE